MVIFLNIISYIFYNWGVCSSFSFEEMEQFEDLPEEIRMKIDEIIDNNLDLDSQLPLIDVLLYRESLFYYVYMYMYVCMVGLYIDVIMI